MSDDRCAAVVVLGLAALICLALLARFWKHAEPAVFINLN